MGIMVQSCNLRVRQEDYHEFLVSLDNSKFLENLGFIVRVCLKIKKQQIWTQYFLTQKQKEDGESMGVGHLLYNILVQEHTKALSWAKVGRSILPSILGVLQVKQAPLRSWHFVTCFFKILARTMVHTCESENTRGWGTFVIYKNPYLVDIWISGCFSSQLA